MSDKKYYVDDYSLTSLRLDLYFDNTILGSATCFIVNEKGKDFLVTNYHVLTGRHPDTNRVINSSAAIPNKIRVWCHSSLSVRGYGAWVIRDLSLYDEEGKPRWIEHPQMCIRDPEHPSEHNVDIVVLPLDSDIDIKIYSIDLFGNDDILVAPGTPVSIIGYPLGLTGADLFPIWKTGHIASDIEAHYSNRFFYIDATTRGGMSGSPVVYRSWGVNQTLSGEIIFSNGITTKLLGIYSGRIHEDSEVGIVWKPYLIKEIIDTYNA